MSGKEISSFRTGFAEVKPRIVVGKTSYERLIVVFNIFTGVVDIYLVERNIAGITHLFSILTHTSV